MKKKRIFWYLLLCLIILNVFLARADIPCGTTISSSGTYVLESDKTCSGTWLTVSAENVVVDLNGHTVIYNSGNGIKISAHGVTVTNGIIIQGSGGEHVIESSNRGKGELSYLVLKTTQLGSYGISAYTGLGGTEIHHVYVETHAEQLDESRNGGGRTCIREDYCNDPCGGDIHDNILVNCHTGLSIEEKSNSAPRNIYNNLVQHKRMVGCKQPMGIAISNVVKNADIHDNQIISDNGRGLYISGYGSGTIGPSNSIARNNRIDVEYNYVAVSGDGSHCEGYVENNVNGPYMRYGTTNNRIEDNIILVDNKAGGGNYGVFVGSDNVDPLMTGLVVSGNTIIVGD